MINNDPQTKLERDISKIDNLLLDGYKWVQGFRTMHKVVLSPKAKELLMVTRNALLAKAGAYIWDTSKGVMHIRGGEPVVFQGHKSKHFNK